jgi:hypothetical protein
MGFAVVVLKLVLVFPKVPSLLLLLICGWFTMDGYIFFKSVITKTKEGKKKKIKPRMRLVN